MTTYISKEAKNGKMQYFRVVDGKKKMIKREEYEANQPNAEQAQNITVETETVETFAEIEVSETPITAEPEYQAEPIPPRSTEQTVAAAEISPFDFVKASAEPVAGRHKVTVKDWTKYASVYYRSCAICGLVFDENRNVTAVKFMGTTLESRKTITEHKIEKPSDLLDIKAFILLQIEFVNSWWNDSQAVKCGTCRPV